MAKILVNAEHLSKGFGGKTLLDGAAFQLEEGERVALVGPNGTGKTTLLRMMAGIDRPDDGSLRLAPDLRAPYFSQHAEVPAGATVRDVLMAAAEVPAPLAAELADLEAQMADPALYESGDHEAVLARYGEVQREVALARAAAGDPLDNPLFEEMGFSEDDLAKKATMLSGGERTRLLLARLLSGVRPGDLLVLDEPTNHLDVETIEWLEEWLVNFQGTVLVVAHDRAFLDNVATRVIAIEGSRLESYPGNYSEYERLRDEDLDRQARDRDRAIEALEKQKAVIQQFRHQKRFDGQMAARQKMAERAQRIVDRTPDPVLEKLGFGLRFDDAAKSSNEVVRARGIVKRYGDRVLFQDLHFELQKGDRVALVGPNGCGKTTLLRMLTGRERKDSGTVEVAPGVRGAYYAQDHEGVNLDRTLAEEVLAARPGVDRETVKALLGSFRFRGDDVDRAVRTLSGGERARLALLKCVIGPANLLILDEPTNHLDIEGRAVVARALNSFKGTLLVVSHDRHFLDSVVDKVAVVARRNVQTFIGDFTSTRSTQRMAEFASEKPEVYRVKKAFKDFEKGVKFTVGQEVPLTPADLSERRLFRTAISMGWLVRDA